MLIGLFVVVEDTGGQPGKLCLFIRETAVAELVVVHSIRAQQCSWQWRIQLGGEIHNVLAENGMGIIDKRMDTEGGASFFGRLVLCFLFIAFLAVEVVDVPSG